jgi:hypothetical protein
MIIAKEQPFKLVDNPLFQKFLASLQPKFKIFSRTTLRSDVMQLFNSMKGDLAREISQVDRIALTTDLWTSSNQTPFMVISAHYILPNWTLRKRLIGFKELPTPHTGITIGKQLITTIGEWKVIDKVAFITVDNASFNDVAVSHLKSILIDRSQNALELDGKFFHVWCAAHIVNLIVKDVLKIISEGITKIRESV